MAWLKQKNVEEKTEDEINEKDNRKNNGKEAASSMDVICAKFLCTNVYMMELL